MESPRNNSNYRSSVIVASAVFLALLTLLLTPAERFRLAVHAQNAAAPIGEHSYASLSADQVAAIKLLDKSIADGAPASMEEKNILRRFRAGVQISELEAQVLLTRVLYEYYVANNYLNSENYALLKKYEDYSLAEHRFIEDARLKMKRESYARQLALEPKLKTLQPEAIPPNDTCAGAIAITDTGSYPITTATVDAVDATTTGDPTFCASQDDTIWYTFVPTITGTYTITTCSSVAPGTGSSDTILGVFTSSGGCAGPFTTVDCNDDDISCGANANASTVSPILTGGTTYYIVAGRSTFFLEPSSVPIQIAITRLPAPANDTCGSATALTVNTPVSGGTTVAANDDYRLSGTTCYTGWGDNSVGNSSSTAVGRDVVYSFTPAASNTYSFRVTKFGNTLDPVLYLMTSCPGGTGPISVTCSNSAGPATVAAHRVNGTGAQEIPCVSLVAGQTVYLVVDEALISTGSTNFTVEVNACTEEPEANDSHANDTPATAGVGTEGVISSNTDIDFYTLGVPTAGSRVFALVDGLAGNSTDFDMRVTNTTDTLEFDAVDADAQFGSLSPVIGGTLLTGVDSYLRISHGGATSASGPYRLYTKVQPAGTLNTPNCAGTKNSATAEAEPNNTAAQANSAVNNYFYGDIPTPAPATDVDYYSFTANAGDLIFMALDGDPCLGSAMNAAMDLRDSADALLIGVNDGDGTNCGASCTPTAGNLAASTPVAPAEALVWRARYTGTYYAKVYTGISTTVGTGDYLLSISVNNDHGPTAADSSISGRVTGNTGDPLAGVNMVLTSGAGIKQTTTDADGHYSFPELETGDFFVVAPAGSNYSFTPSKRPFSLRGNVRNANFTANAIWADRTKSDGPSPNAPLSLQSTGSSNGQSIEQSWATASPDSARTGSLKISAGALDVQQGIAAGPAVKIEVRQSGWFRITQPELLAAGLDPTANARMLQLYVDGVEVPILLSGDSASLKPGDTLEFYGVGLDTPTTDTRTYWLINGNAPGQRISGRRNKAVSNYAPWTESAGLRSFGYTTERKEKLTYFANLLNGEAENIFGQLVMRDPAVETLTAKNLDGEASLQPELEIALQGVTPLTHQVQVKVNGTNVGTIAFDARQHSVTRLPFDSSMLCDGDNLISLAAVGGDTDISFVDWMRLTYARQYVAENNALQFSVPGGKGVRVKGFTSPNIRLIDITNPQSVTELDATLIPEGTGYTLRVSAKGTEVRSFLAFADNLASSPAAVTANVPSSWNAGINAADMLVITNKAFRDSIEPLAAFRRSQGLNVAVIDIEDVYDEFSYGAHTPAAVKDFLAWTASHWTSVPQYVLLVGDSTWDPRNYLGQGNNDFVPTKLIDTFYMETASDDWLVDFNGDGKPNMAIGRLPARSATEVNLMVSKILAYEQELQSGAPLRDAVMVADSGFESESSQTRALLPAGISVQTINRSAIGNDDLARDQIISALDQGPMLVNYYGHGSLTDWTGAALLENDLANGLTNANRLSVFIMMTCLNGYAHDAYIDSLAEATLKAPEGGAMAVWASSGMTEPGPQFAMSSEFYRQAFGNQSLRLGQAIQNAKAATIDNDVRRTWMLLGDPAMRLW